VFAWTIAKDEPHKINAPFTSKRFRDGILIDRPPPPPSLIKRRTRDHALIICPHSVPRRAGFSYGGEAHIARPIDPTGLDDEAWASSCTNARSRGLHAERWRHLHGCGRFFNVLRDTISDTIVAPIRRSEAARAVVRCKETMR